MRVVVIGGWAPSLIKFRGPLLDALVSRGHEVIAWAPDGSDAIAAGLAARGVRYESIALARAGVDPRADAASLVELTRRLRDHAPDLVFAYTIKPVVYGALGAWLARVRHRIAMITGLGYALTTRAGGARATRQRAVAAVARTLVRTALARCELVFLQNADDRVELERAGVVTPATRVAMVRGSGVDLELYAPSPLPDGPPVFLFLGRLLHDKGIREFVEAAGGVRARHPEARFRIVGWLDPNPECITRAQLDSWVGSGAVEYLGACDDVRPHLRAAHVLILPSYHEGTPRSVLEAMSMARAVITTDAPGCRDTVVDGDSGLLVPVRDGAAVAAAALRLVESPALLASLAERGRRRAEQLYDARRIAVEMAGIMGL